MRTANLPRYRFPWRTGNRLRLLQDGDVFFPRMLAAIAGARRYILMEMYLFESGVVADRFIDALIHAAQRGVGVYALLDHFGALGLSRHDRERLSRGGVEVLFYNPLHLGKLFNNFARDHRKLLLVDGATAFVGGVGITDDFDPPANPARRWRETMVEMSGPVATDWQALFVSVWDRCADKVIDVPASAAQAGTDGADARVTFSAGPLHQENKRALLRHIRAAEHRVWISTAYFLPGWRVLRALRSAARRGADVCLLLPGPMTDHAGVRLAGRRYYARLLRHGVRIFEYQPRVLHSKVSLCDQWVTIGSSNYDRWNLRWNLEANLVADHPAFAQDVQAMFEQDFRACIELHYTTWMQRPMRARLWEWVWARVDLWLNALGHGRRDD